MLKYRMKFLTLLIQSKDKPDDIATIGTIKVDELIAVNVAMNH